MTLQQGDCGCFHCGLPVPAGASYDVLVEGRLQPMCCQGCKAVASAIIEGGMGEFYKYRTRRSATARELVPEFLRQTKVYDNEKLQKSFVRSIQEDGRSIREADLILEGIVCAACIWLNERHIAALPGVRAVLVNYTTHRAHVQWDNEQIQLSDILQAISAIGYLAHPYDPGRQQQLLEQERRNQLKRLGLAGVLGMQVMMIAVALYFGAFSGIEEDFKRFFYWISLGLTLPVLLYSASPFYKAAVRDIKQRQAGMDVPVALGISIAFTGSVYATFTGYGEVYYDSVVMFVFLLLTGRYFELVARKKAADSAEHLVHATPAMATRITAQGKEEVIPAVELACGDCVRVRPGETLPADGVIIAGESSIDESLLTGESMPVRHSIGQQVVGGSVNIESPLDVRVEKTGQDTVLSGILRLLDRAQSEKPRITQLADRTAGWFVLAVLVLAVCVAAYWWQQPAAHWLPITVAVLVVTCPCALSLATPTAITAATGMLTQRGLLATRGHALETLAKATHFVFDKTGTLTRGKPEVLEVHVVTGGSQQQLLSIAAAIEMHSEHPIAAAICVYAAGRSTLRAEDVSNKPGNGLQAVVEGQRYWIGKPEYVATEAGATIDASVLENLRNSGNSVVGLACKTELLGWFVIGDRLRDDARQLITELKQDNRQVMLLTGDHSQVANVLAAQVGIEHVSAGLSPEDKVNKVRELQSEGAIVAMLGDGINDAPVLAIAQVSIAMGGGTQLAAATADMILLSDNLLVLSYATKVARSALRIIRQNITWAIAYNVVALPAAAMGYVAPWVAALGMSLSSLIVVGNALRLLRMR